MSDDSNDKEVLRARAVELRDKGYTRRQIRTTLGLRSDWAVTELLDREAPRHPGLRARAKDDKRARARELRLAGKTYPEIAEALGVSRSSAYLWARDLPGPEQTPEGRARAQKRRTAAIRTTWKRKHAETDAIRRATREAACEEIGPLSERDLLLAGAIAYWCEGSKAKPWNPSERVAFINSDPKLVRFFLRFLQAADVSPDQIRFRVQIHERADVEAAVAYWSEVTGFPAASFYRSTLKRHNPKTVRKNVGDDYHGCVIVTVLRCAELYRRIEGWASGALEIGIVESGG